MIKMQDGRPVIVTEATMRPNHCALNTHVSRDPEGFVDTGVKLPGFAPRVYVAISSLRDLSRSMGWPTEEAHAEQAERITALEAELEQARAALADRDEQLAAVAVLKQAGYTQARKPGRPAKAAA